MRARGVAKLLRTAGFPQRITGGGVFPSVAKPQRGLCDTRFAGVKKLGSRALCDAPHSGTKVCRGAEGGFTAEEKLPAAISLLSVWHNGWDADTL